MTAIIWRATAVICFLLLMMASCWALDDAATMWQTLTAIACVFGFAGAAIYSWMDTYDAIQAWKAAKRRELRGLGPRGGQKSGGRDE